MYTSYLPIDTPFSLERDAVMVEEFDVTRLGNVLVHASFFDVTPKIIRSENVDVVINWLDQQITLLKAKRRQVREIRNRVLPVSKLPGHVLSIIFRFLCMSHSPNTPLWLSFSQVCRSWRLLALADFQLWTYIPLKHPNLAKEFLGRVGRCPIEFNADLGQVPHGMNTDGLQDLGILDLAFKHDRNFRVLALYDLSRALIDRHFLNTSFSTLESLRLTCIQDPGEAHGFPYIISPHLKRIYVSCSIFPLKMQTLQHLTHLSVGSTRFYPTTFIPIPFLLKFMAAAPNLTHVELRNVLLAPQASDHSPVDPPTLMSKLMYLKVIGETELTLIFLSGVQLPIPSAACHSGHPHLWPTLQKIRIAQDTPLPGRYHYKMQLASSLADLAYLSRYEDSQPEDGPGEHVFVELGYHYDFESSSHGILISLIGEYISLEDVTELQAEDIDTWDVPSSLPSLIKITLMFSAYGFIEWLRKHLNRASHKRVFPRLTTIAVRDLNLPLDCGVQDVNMSIWDFLEDLCSLKQHGTPLETFIVMESCHKYLDGHINHMRKVLAGYGINLTVDG